MQTKALTSLTGAVLIGLVLAGCSSSSKPADVTSPTATSSTMASTTTSVAAAARTTSTSTTSTAVPHEPEDNNIMLSSPAFKEEEPLPSRYTCTGANVSMPLRWHDIPGDTKELALFMVNLAAVHGKVFAYWALFGLKPTGRLITGRIPPSVIVGRNSLGQTHYSLCPPKGQPTHYIFVIYSLPRHIPVRPGFDSVALREVAFHAAKSEGFLRTSYTRP